MTKLLSGVFLTLMSLLVHAADMAPEVPVPTDVSPWPMIIVVLLLVGMIGGFFVFVGLKERERKARESKGS